MVEPVVARALLEHIRSIRRVMQSETITNAPALSVAKALHDVLDVNICLVADDGRLLGGSGDGSGPAAGLPEDAVKPLNRLDDTVLCAEGELPAVAEWVGTKRLAAVPVVAAGRRLATLLAGRDGPEFGPEEQIIFEYSATLVGLELFRENASVVAADLRRRGAVDQALSALSYSEQEAVRVLFQNLPGDEGVVVASRIADSVGLTRSVIVNALRKLESAGVIASRSLGMKGTFVKVLNRDLLPAVKNAN